MNFGEIHQNLIDFHRIFVVRKMLYVGPQTTFSGGQLSAVWYCIEKLRASYGQVTGKLRAGRGKVTGKLGTPSKFMSVTLVTQGRIFSVSFAP